MVGSIEIDRGRARRGSGTPMPTRWTRSGATQDAATWFAAAAALDVDGDTDAAERAADLL